MDFTALYLLMPGLQQQQWRPLEAGSVMLFFKHMPPFPPRGRVCST